MSVFGLPLFNFMASVYFDAFAIFTFFNKAASGFLPQFLHAPLIGVAV
jgi:hypothetical protein